MERKRHSLFDRVFFIAALLLDVNKIFIVKTIDYWQILNDRWTTFENENLFEKTNALYLIKVCIKMFVFPAVRCEPSFTMTARKWSLSIFELNLPLNFIAGNRFDSSSQ